MPEPWEAKTTAIEEKILSLEKKVSDLSEFFKKNPTLEGAEELKQAKDAITKLNLQLDELNKRVGAGKGANGDGDSKDDFWPI